MAMAINQETFDDVVKENVEEFGMSTEEAIEDAVKQFESQGVDLSNVIKDLMLVKIDENCLNNAISKLEELAKSEASVPCENYKEQLLIIRTQCDKSLSHKVFVGKQGAYGAMIKILMKRRLNGEIVKDCLKTLISLMTKQPDLLDNAGLQTLIKYLGKQNDPDIQKLLLKLIKECCIMHELNRQHIFEASILDHLKPLLEQTDSGLIRDALAVFRALVLDDDVRVEFGRAHEHARVIATNTLSIITNLLSKFKTDEPLISDIILTLSTLLVRTEFCKEVENADGLNAIKDVMITYQARDRLIRQCFKILKALAGNDEVKNHIIQIGLAPLIVSSLNTHKNSVQTSTLGLACLAAVTLRSSDNSKAIFDAGGPAVIVDCMKLHPDDSNIQKNASWAIRNMVSRSRYQSQRFLMLGVEDILKENLKKFVKHEYDTKSALRDLGCDVSLKEEWTGKGGLLTTSQVMKN